MLAVQDAHSPQHKHATPAAAPLLGTPAATNSKPYATCEHRALSLLAGCALTPTPLNHQHKPPSALRQTCGILPTAGRMRPAAPQHSGQLCSLPRHPPIRPSQSCVRGQRMQATTQCISARCRGAALLAMSCPMSLGCHETVTSCSHTCPKLYMHVGVTTAADDPHSTSNPGQPASQLLP